KGNVSNIPDNTDLPLDDSNTCTNEVCNVGVPSHQKKLDGAACNDGDGCTLNDTCLNGMCKAGKPLVCNGGASCMAGACVAPPCMGVLGLPAPPPLPVGTNPFSVATADLNGDGKPDLAVANYNSNSVSVLLNNGNGTFAAKADYPTGSLPRSIVAADLNG